MIDTIEIELHDIRSTHFEIAQFLDKKLQGEGYSVGVVERAHKREEIDLKKRIQFHSYLKFHDTGEVKEMRYSGHLRSDHYNLMYRIDIAQDLILFNFSIPKYLYGNNIQMFTPDWMCKGFRRHEKEPLKGYLMDSYNRFKSFIRRFFLREFGELHVDYDYVRVKRMDLCYNQVFPSKERALEYLAEQKKVRRPRRNLWVENQRNYDTTIWYQNTMYVFKIYHKGTEYSKRTRRKVYSDKAEHTRINRELGYKYFDTEAFQSMADRILRYEISIKNNYMSHLLMRQNVKNGKVIIPSLFRQNCKNWQNWLMMANSMDKNGYVKERNRKKSSNDVKVIKKEWAELRQITKDKIYYARKVRDKVYNFFINCSSRFVKDSGPYYGDLGRKKPRIFREAKFDKRLFERMVDTFVKEVETYQVQYVGELMDLFEIMDNRNMNLDIAERNRFMEKRGIKDVGKYFKSIGLNDPWKNAKRGNNQGISFSTLKTIIRLLKDHKWEQLKDVGGFGERTLRRYRAFLKDIGFDHNLSHASIMNVNYDLNAYHEMIIENSRYLKRLGSNV